MKKRRIKKHWYKIYIDVCVLCGKEDIFRERHYGRKPKKYWSVHVYTEMACYRHFF